MVGELILRRMVHAMNEDDELRRCSECGKVMREGYLCENGCEYYCSDECLYKHYTPGEWEYLCRSMDYYWTEWED